MGYYKEKQVDYEETQRLRAQAEKEKQEGITILACVNSAIALLSHGLNTEDVKRVSLELLEHRDVTLYGEDAVNSNEDKSVDDYR